MDILNPRSLREAAGRALARGREPKKLIYSYSLIILVLSLLVTLADLWLENRISGTGGLSNLGTRAIFSTVQAVLPILLSGLAMCLEFGYLSGMMRIARGQYADHTDLKVGLQKIGPLLRLLLLEALICLALGFVAAQLAGVILAMTPWAEPVIEVIQIMNTTDPATLTEAEALSMLMQLVPLYVIAGIVYLIILIPMLYKLRLAKFCLLDDPSGRALAAIRTSSKLMRHRVLAFVKIDLSLWLYYAANVVMTVLLFLDLILPLLGIPLPMDARTFSLVVYGAALVVQFGIQVTLRNKLEAVYLTAYDRLRDKPSEGGPVVLGNIFDM